MKKMLAIGIVVATWILTCVLAGAVELPPIPPMPEKFKEILVIKPDSSVPKEVADFSGGWEGLWKYVGPTGQWGGPSFGQETRRVKLIVYEISADKIKVLYGWGDSPNTGGYFLKSIEDTYDNKFIFYVIFL